MTKKQKLGCLNATLAALITGPIWYYLLYQLLKRVGASDLMWFLYWAYLPVSLLINIASNLITNVLGDD